MKKFQKKETPKITIFFDVVTAPKVTGDTAKEKEWLDKYFENKKYNFDKFSSYKYNSLTSDLEKEIYIKRRSFLLSQIVSICGTIHTDTSGVIDFKIVDKVNEEEVVKTFINDVVNNYGIFETIWVHYNGLNFECPLIMRKAVHYNLPINNFNFCNLAKFRFTPHYDISAALSHWGGENVEFEVICQEFGIDYKETDLDVWKMSDEAIAECSVSRVQAYKTLYDKLRKVYK